VHNMYSTPEHKTESVYFGNFWCCINVFHFLNNLLELKWLAIVFLIGYCSSNIEQMTRDRLKPEIPVSAQNETRTQLAS